MSARLHDTSGGPAGRQARRRCRATAQTSPDLPRRGDGGLAPEKRGDRPVGSGRNAPPTAARAVSELSRVTVLPGDVREAGAAVDVSASLGIAAPATCPTCPPRTEPRFMVVRPGHLRSPSPRPASLRTAASWGLAAFILAAAGLGRGARGSPWPFPAGLHGSVTVKPPATIEGQLGEQGQRECTSISSTVLTRQC